MKTLLYLACFLAFFSCDNKSNSLYADKLNLTKQYYPFEKWKTYPEHGLTQYTPVNCDNARKIFDDLITALINLGESAKEEDKVAQFKIAIEKLNVLNDVLEGTLIETGEREELCDLTDHISRACGIDPNKYGGGEGLASEWRNW